MEKNKVQNDKIQNVKIQPDDEISNEDLDKVAGGVISITPLSDMLNPRPKLATAIGDADTFVSGKLGRKSAGH